jgi:hypothetical protein
VRQQRIKRDVCLEDDDQLQAHDRKQIAAPRKLPSTEEPRQHHTAF